jgi:hypothetical protein
MQPTRYSDSNSFKAQVIQECAQSSEMELDTDQLPALVDDLAGRIPCKIGLDGTAVLTPINLI